MGEELTQDQKFPEKKKLSDAMATADEENIKKDDDDAIIVLKVYMHCEACARKVARSLKGFPGVEDVMADSNEGMVRVKGKEADPVKVCQRVQEKCRRKVELISPLPQPAPAPPPPPPLSDDKNAEAMEPPAAATVVLNLQMHCEACARVIRKKILKIKGVEFARTDISTNQVSVTGIVDPNELVNQVCKRTKKKATLVLVPPAPPPEVGESKGDEGEKKDGENADMSQEDGDNKDEEKKQEDVKRNQTWPTRHYTDYLHHYAYPPPPPPQIFSDENPNACFIM